MISSREPSIRSNRHLKENRHQDELEEVLLEHYRSGSIIRCRAKRADYANTAIRIV